MGLAVSAGILAVLLSFSVTRAQEDRQVTRNPDTGALIVRRNLASVPFHRAEGAANEPSPVKVPAYILSATTSCAIVNGQFTCWQNSELACPPTVTVRLPDGREVTCDLDCHGREPDPYTELCDCDVVTSRCR